jgi:hypothetical protein
MATHFLYRRRDFIALLGDAASCDVHRVLPPGDLPKHKVWYFGRRCALEVIRRSVSSYEKAKDDQNRSIVATLPAQAGGANGHAGFTQPL